MDSRGTDDDPKAEALWRTALVHGPRHRLAFLPGSRRCAACHLAMTGLGGHIVRATTGIRQSRRNPNLCDRCDHMLPHGGAEVDIAVISAAVRGSTALAEKLGPNGFAALLNRFYDIASRALSPYNAMIDRMAGDRVVAIFFPNTGSRYRANAMAAAIRFLRLLGYRSERGAWIPVGIGINAGTAFCGRIGVGGARDFTAFGDTVEVAARLQAQARAGEIVMSEELCREISPDCSRFERRSFHLRGRESTLPCRVLRM